MSRARVRKWHISGRRTRECVNNTQFRANTGPTTTSSPVYKWIIGGANEVGSSSFTTAVGDLFFGFCCCCCAATRDDACYDDDAGVVFIENGAKFGPFCIAAHSRGDPVFEPRRVVMICFFFFRAALSDRSLCDLIYIQFIRRRGRGARG